MIKTTVLLAMALICGDYSTVGQQLPENPPFDLMNERLELLRKLNIHSGEITLVQHEDRTPENSELGNLPPRTIVKAVLRPTKGSNINIEVWLPDVDQWNSRLVGIGNGGAAGSIDPQRMTWPLKQGYAVATTDMGTAPDANSGIGNPEVWKDFGYRATHLMTVTAKQIIMAYYGKGPAFSYFYGRSTGGQQGLQEAQRYPEDYDGIVTGLPAHSRTPLHAYFLWNDQILSECPFTLSQENHVIAAGVEYMANRETPASAGKFVSDPRCNDEDIEAVIALAMQKDQSLTQDHAEALRKLFDGPRHATTGERIFNGIPLGSSIAEAHGHLYPFNWVFGANKKMEDINFGADIATYTATLGPYLNAENADLSAFEKHGGKIIMTVGSADSIVPYHASLDYYERVITHFGDIDLVKSFFRFYVIPGMAHGGGPGINQTPNDLLEKVRDWRETGTAPEAIISRRIVEGKLELELPLYPYPTKTGWDAATSTFIPTDGPRGGVEPIAERFRPPSSE